MIALVAGLLLAIITIVCIKSCKTESKFWGYPLTLVCIPLFYLGFALAAKDFNAFALELVYAIPFFLIAVVGINSKLCFSSLVIALGYVFLGLHAVFHNTLVMNPGMPLWWPIFTGSVVLTIGAYLLHTTFQLANYALHDISEEA